MKQLTILKRYNDHKERGLHPSLWGQMLRLCAIFVLVFATPAGVAAESSNVPLHSLGDPQELETFIDRVLTEQLEKQHIAGAVVVIVQGDQMLLAKGYGYADIEKQIPVDAETTLFRPGSVSKLFTWTAVMQLVEQGKIDLQADVNIYLTDFKIPDKYQQPITMLDLMSHSAGFDLVWDTMFKNTPDELTSLGAYLTKHIPARIFPPGQVPAYSNFSALLAGHIVEQVSGEPYEQYVDEHILKPLGMDHSSMHQVMPDELAARLSQNYRFNGQYQPYPFGYCQFSPAGGLSATGVDIGRFMLAHLQDGQYNGASILKPETTRLMQTQSYTFDPALPGIAHGFMESTINGQRLIGHDGDFYGWRTLLQLIPTEKVGVFLSYNTDDGGKTRENFWEMFMLHYFPGESVSTPEAPADFASRSKKYTGDYLRSDMVYTQKYAKAFSAFSKVKLSSNNMLLIDTPFESDANLWFEVRPGVVQNTHTGILAVFRENGSGQVQSLAIGNIPSLILIKMPWYGGWVVKNGIMAFSLLIFLSTLIAGLVSLVNSLRKRGGDKRSPMPGQLARWVALVLSVIGIIFVVSMPLQENTPLDMVPVLNVAPWFVAALVPVVVLLAVAAWWKRWWKPGGRLHYTIIALAGLALLWFEAYWGFLAI